VRRSANTVTATALVLAGLLAGGNGVGIRYMNRELEPLWAAGFRFVCAAALLALFVAQRRYAYPRGRALLGAAIFGLLNFSGAFGFAYYALVHIKAGVGSTLLALVPLATLGLAALHGSEKLRTDGVIGGVLALGGVAFVSEVSLSGSAPTLALVALLGSVLCFAEAAVLVRRFPPVQPIVMNTIAMAVGGAALLGVSAIAGESWQLPDRRATWVAFAYLVVAGSIAVFLLYLFVLERWPASRAVYMDVLIPPVTVLVSAWLDDEELTAGLFIGGALILLGAYVGALRHSGEEPIVAA
jgi:drug/metabolite transporter (DMT)-like permease